MASGFRGTVNGAVQTAYNDQPLAGFPGQIAALPDLCLVDGFNVNETNGVTPGLGVVKGADNDLPANEYGTQSSPFPVQVPAGTSTATDFVGIVVRDSAMPNTDAGIPVWPDNTMAPVLREGRIFTTAPVAVDAGDAVWMYVDNATSHDRPIGSFTNADAGSGDTVQIANASWYRSAAAGATDAIIELKLRT